MKPYKNLKTFEEAWFIVCTHQNHTIKALKQTKKEIGSSSFQIMKEKIIETYIQSIERINKL